MKKILIIGENPLAGTKSANEARNFGFHLQKNGFETAFFSSFFGPTKEYLSNKAEYLENTDVFIAPPLNTRYRSFDSQEIADKIIFSSMKTKDVKAKKDGKPKKNMDKFSWEKAVTKWVELF